MHRSLDYLGSESNSSLMLLTTTSNSELKKLE